jgi:hypothetical protein
MVIVVWVVAAATAFASDGNSLDATQPTRVAPTSPTPAAGTPAAVPIVYFPAARYEFPTVVEGQEVVHEFVIANRGTAPLIVERVKSG